MTASTSVPFAQAGPVPVTQPVYESCPTDIGTPSHLLVFFNLNNQVGLTKYLDDAYYHPSSSSFHIFLSASQFDAQYSAPASVFGLVESIFSSNGLTTIATAPMLIMASGTDLQAQSAIGQLSSEPPSVQEHIIGVECMPETIGVQSIPNSHIPRYTPATQRGAYVGTSPFSKSKVCTYNEVVSGFEVWYPCGLQTIYDANPLLNQGISGSHQTIALVDAFGDLETAEANDLIYNNIACSDFALFVTNFNLPSSACSVIYPTGVPVLTATNYEDAEGWSIETALDTQYSHTMAPQAHILEVTSSTDYDDLYASIEYIVQHQSANMISLSWGEWEDLFYYAACPAVTGTGPTTCGALMLGYDEIFQQAAAQGIAVFASSGDYAAYDPILSEVAGSSPATDPWVSAVGGTTLIGTFTASSVSRLEHAWSLGSDSWNTIIGTGGGFSMLFEETPGQQLIQISTEGVTSIPEPALGITFYPQGQRGEPDLSADADPASGVLVVQDGAFSSYIWGGTSLAAPLTAGMTATVQSSTSSITLGDLAPSLYLLYRGEGGSFYVHQTQFSLSQLNLGVQGVMFYSAYGQNGPFYVTPRTWNPVNGLGQLNVYGLSQVLPAGLYESGAD